MIKLINKIILKWHYFWIRRDMQKSGLINLLIPKSKNPITIKHYKKAPIKKLYVKDGEQFGCSVSSETDQGVTIFSFKPK